MTQRQIAKELGISVATVSMALNNSPRVKEETRKRIKQLAIKSNYRINETARSLSCGKTRTIGILFPKFQNSFYAHLADEIHDQLIKRDYMGIFLSVSDERNINKCIDMLIQRKVDGIIAKHLKYPFLARLTQESIPTVFYSVTDAGVDSVIVDSGSGICNVLKHLLELGHRKIGFVGRNNEFEERYTAYRHVMAANCLEIKDEWIANGYANHKQGYAGMLQILAGEDLPSAVVCHSDLAALGAMCAAFEKGLKVPDEIAITGFDNIVASRYAAIPLTTLDVNIEKVSESLLEILFYRLSGKQHNQALHTIITPELVARKSTIPN